MADTGDAAPAPEQPASDESSDTPKKRFKFPTAFTVLFIFVLYKK